MTTLTWAEAVECYGDQWEAIVRRQNLNPTVLPGWIDIAKRVYRPDSDLRVLVCTDGQELIAVVPHFFTSERQLGLTLSVAHLASNTVSYHASLPSIVSQAEALHVFVRSVSDWDVLRISNVSVDDALTAAVFELASTRGLGVIALPTEESPYLPIESDWDKYLATRSKKFRYKLRQREKAVSKNPAIELTTYTSHVDVEKLFSDIVSVDGRSWKASYGKDIGSNDAERRYYELLLPFLHRQGALHAAVLSFEGQPIAYSLCCHWNGWFGQLKTSFDESYGHLSPGATVVDASVRAAFDSGAREFDFLGDTDQHKLLWTNAIRKHHDLFVYSSRLKPQLVRALKGLKYRHFGFARKPTVKPKG